MINQSVCNWNVCFSCGYEYENTITRRSVKYWSFNMSITQARGENKYIHIDEKAYGFDDLVTKKVAQRITGLAKTTFEREVRRGLIAKMSYGSSKQSKVMFYVRDLIAYRDAKYITTYKECEV